MTSAEIDPCVVVLADWSRDAPALAAIRRRVFIEEQDVPEALEWEAIDPDCDWFLARVADVAVGITRLMPEGRIGRMAVLPGWRRRGVGTALLLAALVQARARGLGQVSLHAQVQALPFYARQGFRAEGPIFDEAGIPHQRMTLDL